MPTFLILLKEIKGIINSYLLDVRNKTSIKHFYLLHELGNSSFAVPRITAVSEIITKKKVVGAPTYSCRYLQYSTLYTLYKYAILSDPIRMNRFKIYIIDFIF